ncbi:MAG: L-serine ammonia-lyase [Xanthomonadales bacterium]|nr:L-serine ammonia-lyase [Xanthomonadales bacterium]
MAVSVFDLFKIGIGPSSSHTVGPMKAACTFARRLQTDGLLEAVQRLRVTLFGSLAHTGRGHGTDKAVMLGLEGELPDQVDPDVIDALLERIRERREIRLLGLQSVAFNEKKDLIFRKREQLRYHPNGMRFEAIDAAGEALANREYYSVGGGFVVNQDEAANDRIVEDSTRLPYPYRSADELLTLCRVHDLRIAEIMLANETHWRSAEAVRAGLLTIQQAMHDCMERGFRQEGVLPGGLRVQRRAPILYRELSSQPVSADQLSTLDWINLYALAVNEENAAGGRVVTAPTNGAAGIIPAVLRYYLEFVPGANEDGLIEFLLTAGAIGILYLQNASISGAEVGCQGEVGVACSMAAGGLTAAMGGRMFQVENAAEIGMEHNLGLTCDPVGGLVQIPCIERNAMGAVKAINAQRMAFRGDGKHRVSLDKVIKTMRDTGADMKSHYKETSRGGLAVNVIEC